MLMMDLCGRSHNCQSSNSLSPSPPSTTTHTTTTVGCHPGNELDMCTQKCDYCSKEESCTTLGHIGCDLSLCSWIQDNSSTHGGKCHSPHSTTTLTTTPPTGCEPQTVTDQCFTRGAYVSSEAECVALGPIGCQHQVCHYYALPNGTAACGSRHTTTTMGPCVPATETDECFTLCKSYCTNATSCETLGPQGCGNTPCTWKDNTCQSLSSFIELV